MTANVLYTLPTAVDLLALVICLGALGCRLWILPAVQAVSDTMGAEISLRPLWHLLGTGLAALTVSSLGELAGRAVEMSGLPFPEAIPLLPAVLFHTHYGHVWLIRPVALTGLWLGWCLGKQRLRSQLIPALMFVAGALMAMTRSATGHAADWGDPTFAELMDWLHLITGALWGGGLLALCLVVLPTALKLPEGRPFIATAAQRFSRLAAVALAGVLLTGSYNAWLQVGTFRALLETPYGQTLLVKLFLVIPLLALGASNHYISVPLLQRWAGHPLPVPQLLERLPVMRRLIAHRRDRQRGHVVRQFRRQVLAEAIFVVGILLCTAFLLHGTPARHGSPMDHEGAEPTPRQNASIGNRPVCPWSPLAACIAAASASSSRRRCWSGCHHEGTSKRTSAGRMIRWDGWISRT